MRKIKFLLAAALSMIAWTGAMATVTQPTLTTDPSNPAFYTIKSLRTGKYATYTGASSQLSQEVSPAKASLWFFMENGSGVSIIPAKDPSVKLATHSSATETGAVWYLVENPYREGYFCVTLSNNASSNCWDDQGNHTKIGYWQPSAGDNEGTSWIIEPYDVEKPIDVTYELYDGETKVSSTTVAQSSNSEVAIPKGLTGITYNGFFHEKFCYDYTASGTIGDTDCTINVTRTEKAGVVKALTDLSNNKAYNIGCDRGAMIAYNGKMVNTALNDAEANAQPYGKFALLNYEDNYYIFSIDENKFVKNDASVALDLTAAGFSTEDAMVMTPQTAPYFLWHFNADGKYLNTNGNAPLGYVINSYSTPDPGNLYYMVEAGDFDPTAALAELEAYFHPSYVVTYVVKDEAGNTIFTSDPQPAKEGATITTLPADFQRPFYTYNEVDVTISDLETTVEFTATWAGPFEISADFATAHWYDMAMRGTWYVTSAIKDGDGAYKTQNANTMGLVENSYQWAFIGDGYNGFKIINKAEGDGKSFGWTDATATNSGIPTIMNDGDGHHLWGIVPNTNTTVPEGSFCLGIPGTTLYINQFGGEGGSVKFWNSANNLGDAGSAFTVFDVPTNFASFVADEIAPYFETSAKYFILSDAAKTAVGYDESKKTECSFADYKAMKEKMTTEFLNDMSNYVLPETGYYRIKSANYEGRYMSYAEKNGEPQIATVENPAEASTNVVKLTALDDYKYIVTVGGLSVTGVLQSKNVVLGKEGVELQAVVTGVGKGTFTTGETYGALHCASSSTPAYYLVGWTSDAAASQWIIEDATVESIEATIGETGYATLNAIWPVAVPTGVKAYTGKINDETQRLTLTEVEGTIPAATPVVLKGEAGTYTFNFADDTAALEDNVLKGTYTETEAKGKYVLAQPEGQEIGFYLANAGTIAAGKAYLEVPEADEVKGFTFFFDDATGIANVETATENGAIYNLAGQRVNKAQKGIYIINGKKILK